MTELIKIEQNITVIKRGADKLLPKHQKSVNLKAELQKLIASYKLHKSRMERDFEKILLILQQNKD
jgi:hypothetical protein